jgi:hypothetical protein
MLQKPWSSLTTRIPVASEAVQALAQKQRVFRVTYHNLHIQLQNEDYDR